MLLILENVSINKFKKKDIQRIIGFIMKQMKFNLPTFGIK